MLLTSKVHAKKRGQESKHDIHLHSLKRLIGYPQDILRERDRKCGSGQQVYIELCVYL